ncbi:universal stress protein [Olivibacter sitiensis]|uniref:universal stress protein n=1 Tax=Olivibacter sitiensis TaxID=376470 RepID=UPI000414F4E3|nr:universal stress protein [Olivibacter sitiensis]
METTTYKLRHILIAVDNSAYSEKAVQYGFDLAVSLKARVTLIHVIDPPTANSYGGMDPIMGSQTAFIPELNEIQEENSKELLDNLKKRWTDDDSLVNTVSKIGQPKNEILETAQEISADLIVLGTHGRTGFDHFISGSVSESVARHSVCPVLIVPSKDEKK